MTDTPESTSERIAVAGQRRGVNHALAWSGIAAAAVFIVAVVFFSGFFIGRATDGFGGNRGHCQGTPGMMGPGMMGARHDGAAGLVATGEHGALWPLGARPVAAADNHSNHTSAVAHKNRFTLRRQQFQVVSSSRPSSATEPPKPKTDATRTTRSPTTRFSQHMSSTRRDHRK